METLDELNTWLNEHNLAGLWAGMAGAKPLSPYLWKWADIEQGVKAATQLVPIDSGGRRTINVRHPNYPDRMSNSVHMSVQCVLPGEVATAHRHNPAAIRFIVKGSPKAYTVVEGEPMIMETGDLITTPNWTWHDHRNDGDEPVIWVDGLDVRMVSNWHMIWQEADVKRQTLTKPAGFSSIIRGHARPLWMQNTHRTPPMRYPWGETYQTLTTLKENEADADPCDGIKLSFSHAITGGATLPSFACELQLLTAHRTYKDHRHLSTSIYHVFRGSGATVIDGETFEWGQGDIFLVPPWATHHHENRGDADAILFSMDDWPATEALGLYREEETTAS
jgi:gentisate 1,2-dioxygenase